MAGGVLIFSLNLSTFLVFDAGPKSLENLIVVASVGIATFVSSACTWWLMIESRRTATRFRGASVGVITVIAAQLLTILPIGMSVYLPMFGRSRDVAAVASIYVSNVVGYTLIVTFYSLLFFGIFLFPVGIASGMLMARLRRTSIEGSHGETEVAPTE